MKNSMFAGLITGAVLCAVILAWFCLSNLGGFLDILGNRQAQAQLAAGQVAVMVAQAQGQAAVNAVQAQGQADVARIGAEAQADVLREYTAVGTSALRADTRKVHGMPAAQVAVYAVSACAIAACFAVLAWKLRETSRNIRAITSAHAKAEAQLRAQVEKLTEDLRAIRGRYSAPSQHVAADLRAMAEREAQ